MNAGVERRSENVRWHDGALDPDQRAQSLGYRGATLWMTGLPASGKSTIAAAAEARLVLDGRPALMLDGDNLRHGLNGDLGFSPEDRAENVRRTAHAALLLAEAGVVAVVSLVSPFAADRALAREIHERRGVPFVEVWISTSVEACASRDPKGLYARAMAGELEGLTGVNAPYEAPADADLEIDGAAVTPERAVNELLALLERFQTPPVSR